MSRGLYIALVQCVWVVLATYDGDKCTDKSGQAGICMYILQCSGAIQALVQGVQPTTCGFDQDVPIVCCIQKNHNQYNPPPEMPLTPHTERRMSTTTEYTPEEEIYIEVGNVKDVCRPIRNFTAESTDRIAWKKCLQYQEDLVYPCKTDPLGNKARESNCKHVASQLVVGGVNAGEGEFPHVVMLSYSDDINSFKSECGGSLISDRFILTAAHCTYKRNVGDVQYAATSALKQSRVSKSRIYKIEQRIQHRNYIANYHYYDIALLKTEKKIKLDTYTVPACLDLGDDLNDSEALVAGWGAIIDGGNPVDHLQKVVLNKFSEKDCSEAFKMDRKLPDEFKANIQMCYGDNEESKDACKGDSGGPLQLKMQRVKCMYSIIGITSFGIGCGVIGRPGVFTRVSPFVSWIEEIVWSNES